MLSNINIKYYIINISLHISLFFNLLFLSTTYMYVALTVLCNYALEFYFILYITYIEISFSYDIVAAIVSPFVLSVRRQQGNDAYISTHIPILLGTLHAH